MLKEMEKAFALVRVEENQKSEYASYFLKGEATYWWETIRAPGRSGDCTMGEVHITVFGEIFSMSYAESDGTKIL